MAIRHVGYAIINKKDRILTSLYAQDELVDITPSLDATYPQDAPHKVVRVLIDDGEGE